MCVWIELSLTVQKDYKSKYIVSFGKEATQTKHHSNMTLNDINISQEKREKKTEILNVNYFHSLLWLFRFVLALSLACAPIYSIDTVSSILTTLKCVCVRNLSH